MSKLKDKLTEAFKSYPMAKELFSTADGNVFLEESRAHAHSFNLENRKITPHSRPAKETKEEKAAKAAAEKAAKEAAEKAAKEAAELEKKQKEANTDSKSDEAKAGEKAATDAAKK